MNCLIQKDERKRKLGKNVRSDMKKNKIWVKNIVYDELFEKCPNKNENRVKIKRSVDRMHY